MTKKKLPIAGLTGFLPRLAYFYHCANPKCNNDNITQFSETNIIHCPDCGFKQQLDDSVYPKEK